MNTINFNAPIPLYFQLQEILRDKIQGGQWKPGDYLPSEEELCSEYNLSRVTVRNALGRLVMEGLIERTAGKGTRLAEPKVRETILGTLTSHFASLPMPSPRIVTQVIESEIIEPFDYIRKILKLQEGEKVSKLLRVRYLDGVAMFWSRSFVPVKLCPHFLKSDFSSRSFFEILGTDYGLRPERSVRTIETELASSRDINYLGIKAGTPLAVLTSVCYLKDGTPLEYSRTHYRGDRFKYLVVIKKGQEIDLSEIEI